MLDSGYSRDAFNSLMPLSVGSELHTAIILDFFAFLASVAAHAKSNGFSGQRLARIAGWYAFDIRGTAEGFVDGYNKWERLTTRENGLILERRMLQNIFSSLTCEALHLLGDKFQLHCRYRCQDY